MFKINVVPEIQNFVLQLISTGILFLIIRKFAYAPVKKLLQQRQEYVLNNLKNSEEKFAEAEELKKEYDTRLLEAKKESSEIISQARSYGEDIKTKAINESKELARAEYEKGVKDLENEKAKAMKSLDDEITNIAILAAEKVLRRKVDEETDKDLVKEFIKDLEETHG